MKNKYVWIELDPFLPEQKELIEQVLNNGTDVYSIEFTIENGIITDVDVEDNDEYSNSYKGNVLDKIVDIMQTELDFQLTLPTLGGYV
jgi:predicted peroxiredoxin